MQHPLCKFCLERGIVTPANVVDHVAPHKGDWTDFVTGELQSLCEPCHNSAKRQLELRGYRCDVGIDGEPTDPNHPFNQISIPADEGRYLQHLIREHRPKITLEIGCAFGISSLFICEAPRDVGGSRHIMIDKWSEASRVAAANLNRAGFGGLFEQHIKLSFEALTELRAKGTTIDLAFIDGMHTFDYVLVDFFLTDKLLRPGGIVVIDNYSMPAIYKVCRYVVANLPYQFIGPLVDEQPSVKQRLARHVSSLYPFSKITRPESRDPHLMGLPSQYATSYIALRKLSEDRIANLRGEAGCNRCWDSHAEF